MSYTNIAKHIKELYDIDVSTSTMTNITDKIIPKIAEFKARQLEEIYPIIFVTVQPTRPIFPNKAL